MHNCINKSIPIKYGDIFYQFHTTRKTNSDHLSRLASKVVNHGLRIRIMCPSVYLRTVVSVS
jgi:hypothetical protein